MRKEKKRKEKGDLIDCLEVARIFSQIDDMEGGDAHNPFR